MNRQVLFIHIPSEIIIDILSRLPVRSIIYCKCVSKSWLKLLSSTEFSKSHLLKSNPGLVVSSLESYYEIFKIFEFKDSPDNLERHELHFNPVTKFDHRALVSDPLRASVAMHGSANGFLFLREVNILPNALYICNPITRDYIQLPTPEGNVYDDSSVVAFGFGASQMSGQYKVVRIFHDCVRDRKTHPLSIPKSICHVYTLGTGSWRCVAPGAPLQFSCNSTGAFLHGNLHWLVTDLKGLHWISCFDLQTEDFTTFSPPPKLQRSETFRMRLADLGNCLCLCDNSSESEIVIWYMKEYGVEKSWTKEFIISKIPDFADEFNEVVYPIKVFKNGDILMAWDDSNLFYYSSKSRALSNINMFTLHSPLSIQGRSYTPSFLSLKCFTMEDANSF